MAGKVGTKRIKEQLTGLRSWHTDLGLDASILDSDSLRRMIRGAGRYHGEASPKQVPITLPILRKAVAYIRRNPTLFGGSKASATLIAAYTLAFAGVLRCGSFTYDAFDPAFNLAGRTYTSSQIHHMCICQPTRRTPSDMGSKSISQSARQRTYVPLGCYDTLLLIGPETQKRPSFLFHLPNPYSLDPLSSQAPCYGHEGGMSPGKIHRALVSEGRCDMGFVGGVHSGGG